MSTEITKLDGLPVEILGRIASIGTCEAALALSKVNRILHTACNDRLVYKAILDNRNGNGGQEWQHRIPLSMESPVSSWARYALADSRAAQDYTVSLEPRTFASWAPQLMAYHHPFLNLASASSLTDAFTLTQTKAADSTHALAFKPTNLQAELQAIGSTHALAFCLALRLMSEEPLGHLGPQWPTRNTETPWARTRTTLTRYLKQPLYLPTIDPSHFSVYNPRMLLQKRSWALVAVGLLSVMLRETIELGQIRRVHQRVHNATGYVLVIPVPTSTSIPFHSMMDVPLPFSPNATTELASCHLAKMTTADFLEDGEWAGYYSYGLGGSGGFDPPMHSIRFVATANSDSPTTLNLHGVGTDGIGSFDLDGKLVPETGQVLLKKVYWASITWDWACMMTPMGIVGSWGRSNYGGWVWLWKTGWTAGH
ncbi:MAG: hypothetical protein ASARMPRED_006960 [Alectoria sarmentosa]|nr:MAG: hypothetical protein ASARMPRED_006960 [Alectoria sarmentosa]